MAQTEPKRMCETVESTDEEMPADDVPQQEETESQAAEPEMKTEEGERPEREFRQSFRGPGFKPLKVGDTANLKIIAKGGKGDGIAKEKGLVVFVAGAEIGQDVTVKITKVLRNFAVGEIVA